MPWSETTPMDERLQFVADLRRGTEEMAVLCRRYGVSRKTGYKWRDRYAAEGAAGLAARSHAVHACPHATAPGAVDALCELRRRHPTWGPGGPRSCSPCSRHGTSASCFPHSAPRRHCSSAPGW